VKILKRVTTPMSIEDAEKLAATLNKDVEDDWNYEVDQKLCADDVIRSFVDAYDETGKFIGTL